MSDMKEKLKNLVRKKSSVRSCFGLALLTSADICWHLTSDICWQLQVLSAIGKRIRRKWKNVRDGQQSADLRFLRRIGGSFEKAMCLSSEGQVLLGVAMMSQICSTLFKNSSSPYLTSFFWNSSHLFSDLCTSSHLFSPLVNSSHPLLYSALLSFPYSALLYSILLYAIASTQVNSAQLYSTQPTGHKTSELLLCFRTCQLDLKTSELLLYFRKLPTGPKDFLATAAVNFLYLGVSLRTFFDNAYI